MKKILFGIALAIMPFFMNRAQAMQAPIIMNDLLATTILHRLEVGLQPDLTLSFRAAHFPGKNLFINAARDYILSTLVNGSLVDGTPKIFFLDARGRSVLHWAAELGDFETVAILCCVSKIQAADGTYTEFISEDIYREIRAHDCYFHHEFVTRWDNDALSARDLALINGHRLIYRLLTAVEARDFAPQRRALPGQKSDLIFNTAPAA